MHDETFESSCQVAADLVGNVERVIVGKHDAVVRAVKALLARGHILVEDVPGVGKTVLAKAIATSIQADFKRVQFTADLLPSDVTGVSIYDQHENIFRFRPGPLFAHVLLGDEINRATPRTQSSLLEAMEEEQATVDGVAHPLQRPFFVIATQNPIELEGTYPLPFAQMDRFIIRLRLGYLSAGEEALMAKSRLHGSPLSALTPVIDCAELIATQDAVCGVRISDDLIDYVVRLVQATRVEDGIEYGASPRGTLDLVRYSQATALLDGRSYVLPDDIKESATAVLSHRLVIRRGTRRATLNSDDVLHELIERTEVPL
ncbi:MAG: MoxR family ATPase [Lentisphaerae bacterium]|jgi:MoxR-like ATPase|nr:MoxR family ATPase [Lentisphaerota bacterium]MBT4815619.1 MoxR family ATPase [Lentisphaerota bacterium]MBT5607458.1 MoxR family ATPase [Lentisphaerota bacterium]MBT7055738.1 MoxR family ATPase [Lentisphaerota bacterium]MBT7843127.1 MoxR family ATPase [Lentisphaerota bacterium]